MDLDTLTECLCDLHVHTPIFPDDYYQDDVDYIDIIEEAVNNELQIIAFTDHNSVAGYRNMITEYQKLVEIGTHLRKAGVNIDSFANLKLLEDKLKRLKKYLYSKDLLVLPGVEISVNGVHILGIFDCGKNVDESLAIIDRINALLTEIGILPENQNLLGYCKQSIDLVVKKILDYDGIPIAAHTLSSDGLHAKLGRGLQLQETTQHLMAIEVKNFQEWKIISEWHSGDKQGYKYLPCIMSSDAHFIHRGESNLQHKDRFTFSDKRATKILLPSINFENLYYSLKNDLKDNKLVELGGDDSKYLDSVLTNRPSNVFFIDQIPSDPESYVEFSKYIAALANTCEGKIILGVNPHEKAQPRLISISEDTVEEIQNLIRNQISPNPDVSISRLTIDRNTLIEISILKGSQRPYVLRENGSIYLFDSGEIRPSSQADILDLVRPTLEEEFFHIFQQEKDELELARNDLLSRQGEYEKQVADLSNQIKLLTESLNLLQKDNAALAKQLEELVPALPSPNSGIEVLESIKQDNQWIHTLRDLRNDRSYYHRTWENTTGIHHYAISEHENLLATNFAILNDAMESRQMPGIWVSGNLHNEQWKFNFYDFRGGKKTAYYSVFYDSLAGIWLELAGTYLQNR